MASRKVMFRSLSGDGRSGYHNRDNHTAQNGRTSICSYLNSVRPERSYTRQRYSQYTPSRSTLCSVMAQLTEETQPSFETTLRSKAVSETSNVKFSCVVSGYPAPEVTWYKDDMQLDRYCGLPKYEISCEGKNHTLHIYNCTLDDAAIYQASAQNSRGIVSCSGVLEVGIMSEFKIHQNYFAKLKQRAESKRREQEEPRIQNSRPEPPSSVGPERAQRKRRSPMQAVMSLSDTNSIGEMEEQEALNKTPAMEDRLSGLTSERTEPLEVSDKVVTDENKVSAENSIPGRDESNTGLTYIHDTVNMTTSRCTAKQPNTKKKIKISEDKHSTEKQTVRGKETDMEKLGHAAQNVGVLVPKEKAAVQSQSDKPNAQATFSPKTQRVKKTSIATQTESISETKTQACAEPKIKEKTEENDPSSAQSHTLPHLSKAPQQVSSQIPECLSQTSADTHMDVEESSAVQCETAPSALIPMATEDMAGKVDQRLRTTSGTVSPGPGGLVPVKTETTMTSHQSWNGGERDQLSTQTPFVSEPLDNGSDQIGDDFEAVDTRLTNMTPTAPEVSPASLDKVKTEGTGTRGTPLSVENGKTQTDSPKTRVSSSYSSPKADTTLKTSATPKEIASGARRKTISSLAIEKEKGGETVVSTSAQRQGRGEKVKEEESPGNHPCRSQEIPHALPQQQLNTPSPLTLSERRSPKTRRRMLTPEPPKPSEESAQGLVQGSDQVMDKMTAKTAETDKQNPFKAPQVIRKIRAEALSDTLGHLKLWCQFFNVLGDSTLKWYRDEVQIAEIKRSAGDESHVNLALVQTSTRDSGVYSCTITNEYGTVTTDYLLSPDIGEEIEMTPLLFSKGLADAGSWGNKFFGRVMTEEAQVGVGCEHKTTRVKVIYGLDPVFESGKSCFVKVRNPIAYGSEDTCSLAQKNLDMTKQDCKIQNMAREYCKIFAAEAREFENFGPTLEVMPLHLMYRPASSVPYATIEAELKGVYLRYCGLDRAGELIIRDRSQIELKCSALQHWIHQWTNGNLLFTRLEGVDTKLTNIGISFRSKGYQGLPVEGNPKVFELFQALHQCNYYCGLLSLRPLKTPDTLLTPARPKGSRSPLLHRRITPGSSSPQTQRRPTTSNRNASTKDKTVEVSKSGRR
ncbi:alpha-protein kinase 3 [Chanos chanos]|uniref:non-specific serine/threonine protein kinase n=1 Tax=Chanos chanos TaxID=29144 RepID=A0A6J2UL29_CHACN|nr:alpha-protein kinase 3-like [Chanos chanos]